MTIRDPEIPLLARRRDPRKPVKPRYAQRKLEIFFWTIAIVVTLVVLLRAGRWRIGIEHAFGMPFTISPYVIMFCLVSRAYRSKYDPSAMWIGRIVSALLLVATVLAYSTRPSSSTYGLIFIFVPLWLLCCGVIILTLSVLVLRLRTEKHLPLGHCQECGYNLRGNVSGVCPECGTKIHSDNEQV